jgi:cell division protease FtsH
MEQLHNDDNPTEQLPKIEQQLDKDKQSDNKTVKKATPNGKPPRSARTVAGAIIGILFLMSLVWFWASPKPDKIDTSDGLMLIHDQKVARAQITEFEQQVVLELKEPFRKDATEDTLSVDSTKVVFYYNKDQGATVWQEIRENRPEQGFDTEVPQVSFLESLAQMLLPMLFLVGIFLFLASRMNGENSPFSFGKARTKVMAGGDGETPDTTFKDVAGVDEAIVEMQEVRDFMAEPDKYKKIGAKIPKGVLLYGPPGTGKTLLARAVAGEAKVPYFSLSGSDFVEMFVGVGASRVRDLFKRAKQVSPSIIFIDEIDAVGRHRGSGIGGGHDEREQTLNQMLVEMDGFDGDTNVLLIAATNRPDILDPALLRPGRFDRQIAVDAPDLKGREAILAIHAANKPFEEDVALADVAKRTPGYTGADLANVVNEAALLAARENKDKIGVQELDESIDRVMAGPQRRSRKMNDKDLRNTAYHESGHALVAAAMHYTDPVTKVTILPRGRALGYTSVMPTEDKYSVTRNELLDQMAYAMGGRVAEEIVFIDPSTGASNDIEKATDIARKMVTLYGMSSRIGPVKVAPTEDDQAIGVGRASRYATSPNVANLIDQEIQQLLVNAHAEATTVINENREVLDRLANTLLEKETLLEDELAQIFQNVKFWGQRNRWDSITQAFDNSDGSEVQ